MKIKRTLSVVFALTLPICAAACSGPQQQKESEVLPLWQQSEPYNGTHIYNIAETDEWLVRGGVCDYVIVLPAQAEEYEIFAASELAQLFAEATGCSLAVVGDDEFSYDTDARAFAVGQVNFLGQAGIELDAQLLGHSGFRIVTKGNSVFMAGAEAYGTMCAVYEFLHLTLGFEQYSSNAMSLDRGVTELPLSLFDVTDVPDFQYRVRGYGFLDGDTTLRNRFRMQTINEIAIPVDGSIHHNSFKWLPKEVWQSDHPEWYSEDGRQLCYTAHGDSDSLDEMVFEVTEKMKTILMEDRDRQYITITHEDTQTWCTCTACTAERERYGGANSAVVIKFLNRVSRAVRSWFSGEGAAYARDLKILFFAYHQTNKPPVVYDAATDSYSAIDESVLCDEGVAVYFAETNGDYTQSFYERNNAEIADNMRGWSALCDTMFFWTYGVNFSYYLTPYNCFNSMQDTYRFAVRCNPVLIFDQGAHNETAQPTAWGSLNAYLGAKLAWNVDSDVGALTDAFFTAQFGKGAESMRAMYDMFRMRAEYNEAYNGYSGSRSIFIDALQEKFWSKGLLENQLACVQNALEAIAPLAEDDPENYNIYYRNIVAERISPVYMLTEIYADKLKPAELEAYRRMLRADLELIGTTRLNEKTEIGDLLNRL